MHAGALRALEFDRIVEAAARVLGCRAAAIRLLDRGRSQVEFAASWGLSETYRDEVPEEFAKSTLDRDTLRDGVVHVEKHPEIFSSARSIVLGDPDPDFPLEAGFITMDGVKHDAHRKVIQPVAAPRNIGFLEPLIR